MIDQVISLMEPVQKLLDTVDPKSVDKAIEELKRRTSELEGFRTLLSMRQAEIDSTKPRMPIIPLSAMIQQSDEVRAICDGSPVIKLSNIAKSRVNRVILTEWLRANEPATITEMVKATGIVDGSVRNLIKDLCEHDDSTPVRYKLRVETLTAAS